MMPFNGGLCSGKITSGDRNTNSERNYNWEGEFRGRKLKSLPRSSKIIGYDEEIYKAKCMFYLNDVQSRCV